MSTDASIVGVWEIQHWAERHHSNAALLSLWACYFQLANFDLQDGVQCWLRLDYLKLLMLWTLCL